MRRGKRKENTGLGQSLVGSEGRWFECQRCSFSPKFTTVSKWDCATVFAWRLLPLKGPSKQKDRDITGFVWDHCNNLQSCLHCHWFQTFRSGGGLTRSWTMLRGPWPKLGTLFADGGWCYIWGGSNLSAAAPPPQPVGQVFCTPLVTPFTPSVRRSASKH